MRRTRLLRLLLALPAAALAAVGLCGCVGFLVPPTIVQTNVIGNVIVQVEICNGGTTSPTCPDPIDPDVASAGTGPVPAQILLGLRVPDGSEGPASFPTVSGPALTFTRSPSYEQELTLKSAPIAGHHWVGYVSEQTTITPGVTPKGVEVQPEFTLPRGTDGSPFPTPYRFRAVVGLRGIDASNPVTAPVQCASTLFVYAGLGYTTLCSDDPGDQTGVDTLVSRTTSDLGIVATGASATVSPGGTTSLAFVARYSGPAKPGASFALAAEAASLPGASVVPNVTVLAPASNSTTPIPVTVTVPAGTAPGTYDVRLVASLPNGQTRAGTGQVTVLAPDVPAPPPPPAAPPPPGVADPQVGSSRLRLRSGKVSVVLACPIASTAGCAGTVTLSARGRIVPKGKRRVLVLGSAAFVLPAGGTGTVGVPVARDRRGLVPRAKGRTLPTTLVVRVATGSGTRVATRRVIPLGR